MESEEPQVGRTCSEVAMEPHQEICIIGSDRSQIALSAVRQPPPCAQAHLEARGDVSAGAPVDFESNLATSVME